MNILDTTNQQPDPPQIDPNKDYLEELVGPGKKFDKSKYSSEQEAYQEIAKGKYFADKTISVQNRRFDELSDEYKKLREEANTRTSLEEIKTQIEQLRSSERQIPNAREDNPPYKPEQIEALVEQKIQAAELGRKQTQNTNLVLNKLRETWGDNFSSVLKQRTEALGLSEQFVSDLARQHPEVLFRTLGVNQQPTGDNLFQAPPHSRQRADTFAPKPPPERTWSYYKALKAKDPQAWFDPKIGAQMAQDAVRLGDRFQDGDFYKPGLHEQEQ